jgi:hypothetical protein
LLVSALIGGVWIGSEEVTDKSILLLALIKHHPDDLVQTSIYTGFSAWETFRPSGCPLPAAVLHCDKLKFSFCKLLDCS